MQKVFSVSAQIYGQEVRAGVTTACPCCSTEYTTTAVVVLRKDSDEDEWQAVKRRPNPTFKQIGCEECGSIFYLTAKLLNWVCEEVARRIRKEKPLTWQVPPT